MNPKATFSDDRVELVEADLTAVVRLLSASRLEPAAVDAEDEGVEEFLYRWSKGTFRKTWRS